jgi:hypothetical protein
MFAALLQALLAASRWRLTALRSKSVMNSRSDITGPIIGLGGLIWVGGMLFGLFLCLLWLKDGFWTSFTLVGILGVPGHTGWGGVDQIIQWICVQPLWAVIAGLGMAIAALALIAEST